MCLVKLAAFTPKINTKDRQATIAVGNNDGGNKGNEARKIATKQMKRQKRGRVATSALKCWAPSLICFTSLKL